MPNPFYIKDAKFLLLTYPQVPPEIQDAIPTAIVLAAAALEAECIVSRELHSDGGVHFHSFVDFGGRKYSTRNVRVFDVLGRHPNIERVGRTPDLAWDYVCKDGDIVAGGAERPTSRLHESSAGCDWERIVSCETREEFFAQLEGLQPKHLVCNFPAIVRFADWKYKPVPEPYHHPEEWSFRVQSYPVLLNWVDESLRGTTGMCSQPGVLNVQGIPYGSSMSTGGPLATPSLRPRQWGPYTDWDRQAQILGVMGRHQNW